MMGATMKSKTPIRVYVDEWLLDQIDKDLSRLGSTRSEVCRYILTNYYQEKRG